jgi:hypothetical protein
MFSIYSTWGKWHTIIKSPAYHDTELITAVLIFTVQTPGTLDEYGDMFYKHFYTCNLFYEWVLWYYATFSRSINKKVTLSITTFSIMTLCHYAECYYAGWRVLFIIMLSVIILNVVMLKVIMLSVVAPTQQHTLNLWRAHYNQSR